MGVRRRTEAIHKLTADWEKKLERVVWSRSEKFPMRRKLLMSLKFQTRRRKQQKLGEMDTKSILILFLKVKSSSKQRVWHLLTPLFRRRMRGFLDKYMRSRDIRSLRTLMYLFLKSRKRRSMSKES